MATVPLTEASELIPEAVKKALSCSTPSAEISALALKTKENEFKIKNIDRIEFVIIFFIGL
jgi:hypothetical protein